MMIPLIVLVCLTIGNIQATKTNYFEPILSSNAYAGRIQENERIVQLEPRLYASDADPSNTNNGKICGYELSLHKHDELADETSFQIPFYVDMTSGTPVMKLKTQINRIDCEIKQVYRLFIRAYDCADENQRRYSERSSLIITVNDVNEFVPLFTHQNYLFKLHQDQICSNCRVEAIDDDCSNENQRVCDYRITTPNMPFSIDSNGSISITKPLIDDKYDFDVVAIDCLPSADNNDLRVLSEPATVTIKIVKSCQPTIIDNNPTKLTIQTDHTHLFEAVHVDTCDETCAVESIRGTVTLDSNELDRGCNVEQCASANREYVLVAKDGDSSRAPDTEIMSFDGISQSVTIDKSLFSSELKNDFTIRMWMKHADQNDQEKENILCKSDRKLKNRHHFALFLQNGFLKLLIRKGPLNSNEQDLYASEWKWKVAQINDDQWHSYKLFVNYPNKIDLYIDDQLFVTDDDNFELIEDYPLTIINGTEETTFALGACWHGRASVMVQHFHGQLSGLAIEQKEDLESSIGCTRDCQEYLDIPDVQSRDDLMMSSNVDRSIWTIESDSSESFEQLLKHLVYRNTFEPLGPSGQRMLTLKTTLKCLGENFTTNLPTFTRRLAIDEILPPTNIELRGDSNYLFKQDQIDRGIDLFQTLSILTDNGKREQVDLTDCSINTTPDFDQNEQLIVPNEYFQVNNIEKVPTKTGLVLSGMATIDIYEKLLRQIKFVSKSPIAYFDRTFSLVCIGTNDRISTNEIRVQIHIEQSISLAAAPVAAILSNKLYVDNEDIRNNLFDIEEQSTSSLSGWPIAVVVCISVSVAGVLVLYLVTRIRSGNRQCNQSNNVPGDDIHSQMEWEDDIGLNIIVNPLDETKKSVQSIDANQFNTQVHDEYEGTSSDDDEYDGHSHNEYSSENDDEEDDYDDEDECEENYYDHNQIHSKQHQLEWDDEALEYGPRKV